MVDWKNPLLYLKDEYNDSLEPSDIYAGIFVTAVALGITAWTGMHMIFQDDTLKDRSETFLLNTFNQNHQSPTLMDVADLKEDKSHIKTVSDKVFTLKDVFQNTDKFTDSLIVTITINNDVETPRLTLRDDGKPSLLEVNSKRPAEENGADADQLIDTARRHLQTLEENDLPGDQAMGVYEVKDGSVIFQAKEQPDTAQVMSLPAPTAGGPS